MYNINFISYLQKLSADRFALNALPDGEYQDFLHTLLAYFGKQELCQYYLIGTDGCHLCDDVKALCQHLNISIISLELSETDDVLIDTLGVMIPILVTPTALLCYPFGIMDLAKLPTLPK